MESYKIPAQSKADSMRDPGLICGDTPRQSVESITGNTIDLIYLNLADVFTNLIQLFTQRTIHFPHQRDHLSRISAKRRETFSAPGEERRQGRLYAYERSFRLSSRGMHRQEFP